MCGPVQMTSYLVFEHVSVNMVGRCNWEVLHSRLYERISCKTKYRRGTLIWNTVVMCLLLLPSVCHLQGFAVRFKFHFPTGGKKQGPQASLHIEKFQAAANRRNRMERTC